MHTTTIIWKQFRATSPIRPVNDIHTACDITLTTVWQLLLLICKTSQMSHPRMSAESNLQVLMPCCCTLSTSNNTVHICLYLLGMSYYNYDTIIMIRSCSTFPFLTCLAVYSMSLIYALRVGHAVIYRAYPTIHTLYCMPMSLAYCTHCAPPQKVLPNRMMKISPDFSTGFLI